jgi:hypothetical protein
MLFRIVKDGRRGAPKKRKRSSKESNDEKRSSKEK